MPSPGCRRRSAYAIPPIVYGKSEEHLHFPGTLTLSGDTLLHTLLEIAESSIGPVFASC